jgi:heterodisulfide reductase subunit D
MEYLSLEELHLDMEKTVLDNCIQCGDCVAACPSFLAGKLNEKNPVEIAEKMFAVVQNGINSDEAYLKAYSCMDCEKCSETCPQELNPMDFNQAVRNKLFASGKNLPGALGFVLPNRNPFSPKIINSILMKPSEARWLGEAPPSPEKKETIIFMGCGTLLSPDQNFALIDIVEKFGIDYAALIGGKICCGQNNIFAGDIKEAESLARNLIKNIECYSPKRLIVTCPSCYHQLANVFPRFLSYDFEVEFFTKFLMDNLDKIEFSSPLNKKVTLHEPCRLSRGIRDYQSARAVIQSLPGVEIVEMEHNKEDALCCGNRTSITFPRYSYDLCLPLLKEGEKSNADCMINICPGCHTTLCRYEEKYSYELTSLPSLISEAMGGIRYEDKYKKYFTYKNHDKIIEESRDCMEASDFSFEELKNMIPFIFPAKKST